MKHIKRYNESFDSNEYLDYLLTYIDDSKIISKDEQDNFIYIKYDISLEESKIVIKYLEGKRFEDVKIIYKWGYDAGEDGDILTLFIIDNDFYDRNEDILVDNIQWDTHPLVKELEKTRHPGNLDPLFDRFKNAKKAIEIDNKVSIIKNLDRDGIIEIWPMEVTDDPIRLWDEDDMYFQYLLYLYLGK